MIEPVNCDTDCFRQITNIDVSTIVIKQMKAKFKSKAGLVYEQMDATQMSFQDASFNVILDKGTLDALMPDSAPETIDRINSLFDVSVCKLYFFKQVRFFCSLFSLFEVVSLEKSVFVLNITNASYS